jgi:hypothetical protein
MRRIYFLVPDINVTKRVVNELLLARIEEKHIHVLAKRGTPLEELPEANLLQKTDFVPAVQQGLAVGGSAGLLAGLVAVALPPAAPVIAGGILLGTTVVSAGLGAWISGMIGVSTPNRRVKEFEDAIEAGHLLVFADVPADRVEEIEEHIREHIGEVEVETTEPKIPAFP